MNSNETWLCIFRPRSMNFVTNLVFWVTAPFFCLAMATAQDIILPLPTTIKPPPPKDSPTSQKKSATSPKGQGILRLPQKINEHPQQSNTPDSTGLLLPLPSATSLDKRTPQSVPAPQTTVTIPARHQANQYPPPEEPNENNHEIVIPGSDDGPSLIEIGTTPGYADPNTYSEPMAAGAATADDGQAVVYPKDTSSAIFMVMKTWECQEYDGPTLVEHALTVYGQEAEDTFTVLGLRELPPFRLNLNEEDVTLDELLDVVAQQASCDWGVDIPQKTVHFYLGKQKVQ